MRIRDSIGKRFAAIDNEVYDSSLLVLLDHPLRAGDEEKLVVLYEMKTLNYVSGRDWYPGTGNPWSGTTTYVGSVSANVNILSIALRYQWGSGPSRSLF